MQFVSKTVVERTPPATRQSIKQGDYMCHVYVRENGLAGVLISDHEYPHRVAHSLLGKVLNDFCEQVPQNQWSTNADVTIMYEQLPAFLAKYQVPSEADAMTKIEEELDETKIILRETIQSVLKRGEKMEDLVAKSEELSSQSKMFYKTARKTNSCCNF
ncbi:UNVERIFIED_CONTAM: hypothetical protein PYX00_004489 [Menopon gallinae]|uniref:Uncharacterized protein n=1 Tax=Menopon gallinae TaxID=328185 RepID=A0AAW2I5B9_9NEOP